MNQSRGRTWRVCGRLAIVLLVLLALSSGVVGAQTEATPDALDALAVPSNATSISLELSVSEISDPGRLWLDDAGLHMRGLAGITTVSGDITGSATTQTNIGWSSPCHSDTLVCRGAQVSFQNLTITDDNGAWSGDLQLMIDPAQGEDVITGILRGERGNSGAVLYINEVTDRTETSLSVAGYRIENERPVGGVNLSFDACLHDATTATGAFVGNSNTEDSGGLSLSLTRGIDPELGTALEARFAGERGTLVGSAVEMETTDGGAAGRFVLLGGDGEYANYLGFGRTGSQLTESDSCAGGYALSSFWIGEVYLGSASR